MAWPPSPPGDDDLPRRCRSPSTSPPRIGRRRSCPAVIRASTSLGSSCYAHDGVTSCEDGTIIIRSSRVVPLSMRKVVCRLSRGKTIVYGSLSDDDLTDTYVPTTPAEHLEFDKVDKTFKISRSESDNLVKHECRDYLKLADEAEPEQPRKELGFEIVSSGKDYAEAGEIFPLGFEIVSGGKDFCDEAVEQLPSAEHSFLLWDFMLSDQMHCKKDLIEVTDIAVGPQIVSNADVLFTFDELSSMTTNFESSNLIPSLDNTFYGFHPTHGKVVVRVFLRSDTSQTRMYESALCRPKSHPNVATFLGRSCDDPDFLCIVYKLPYCDTLATILNDPSFDLSKRLRVALCVARGVEYLTAFDKFPSAPLSPDHIFLQEDGSALIMDYLGDTAGKTEDIISQYSAILLLLFPSFESKWRGDNLEGL